MTLGLETLDYVIFCIYFAEFLPTDTGFTKIKGKQSADSKDFFAEGSDLVGNWLVNHCLQYFC